MPDLVMLHDDPPDMDGFSIVKLLRVHLFSASIPVIAFNTGAGGKERRRVMAKLSDVLLPLPCTVQDLHDAIHHCVLRYDARTPW